MDFTWYEGLQKRRAAMQRHRSEVRCAELKKIAEGRGPPMLFMQARCGPAVRGGSVGRLGTSVSEQSSPPGGPFSKPIPVIVPGPASPPHASARPSSSVSGGSGGSSPSIASSRRQEKQLQRVASAPQVQPRSAGEAAPPPPPPPREPTVLSEEFFGVEAPPPPPPPEGDGGGHQSAQAPPTPCSEKAEEEPAAGDPELPPNSRAAKEAEFQAFLKRQGEVQSFALRRARAEVHIKVNTTEDKAVLGAKGVDGLREFLVRRFGSIVSGWRQLDPDCLDRLTFFEFCGSCRRLGFHGNLKNLWKELDTDLRGFTTLSDLQPRGGDLMQRFRDALQKEYSDILVAWDIALDKKARGYIELKQLSDCCAELKLDINVKALYRNLRASGTPHPKGVTLENLDTDAHRRKLSGKGGKKVLELCMKAEDESKAKDDGEAHGDDDKEPIETGSVAWRERLRAAEARARRVEIEEAFWERNNMHSVQTLKATLLKRNGSFLAAWRDSLDLDGNGRLTFTEFCIALDRLGFSGNIKKLWEELDVAKKGYLDFGDFDKETATLMDEFHSKLKEKHGTLLVAWAKEMDTKHRGRCDQKEFVAACRRVGFSGNPNRLFNLMKPEVGRRTLTLRDFDTKAYRALVRGDYRMLSEGEGRAPKLSAGDFSKLPFLERQQACFFHEFRAAWIAAQHEEYRQTTREVEIFVIDTPEEFEEQCIRRYGTMIQAWRQCLDYDHNGKLTFNEFCGSCRRMGYEGSLKKLWKRYAGSKTFIEFKDLDPKIDGMIGTFLELLTEKYGTIDIAWKKGFKKHVSETIDELQMETMCHSLSYPYNAARLFQSLLPFQGGVVLSIWDIDPSHTRQRQRPPSRNAGPHGMKGRLSVGSLPPIWSTTMLPSPCGSSMGQLHRALESRFCSTVAAWRYLVGGRQVQFISFTMFFHLLQLCEFSGNCQKLWLDVAGEEPILTFQSLDPPTQALLASARRAFLTLKSTLWEVWPVLCQAHWEELEESRKRREAHEASLFAQEAGKPKEKKEKKDKKDKKGEPSEKEKEEEALLAQRRRNEMGKDAVPLKKNFDKWPLDEVAFESAISKLGLKISKPKQLFRCLLGEPDRGQRSLVRTDLKALLMGLSTEEADELWGAPPAKAEKNQREHFADMLGESQSQDKMMLTLADLKAKLVSRFGSLYGAWMCLLDTNRNGVLTKKEFADRLRELGCRVLNEIWGQLDPRSDDFPDGRGRIFFEDFDPRTAVALDELKALLMSKFGSTLEGWKRHFEQAPPAKIWVDEERFVKQCSSLGFKRNARQLFHSLIAEPGRRYITAEELWSSADAAPDSSPRLRALSRQREEKRQQREEKKAAASAAEAEAKAKAEAEVRAAGAEGKEEAEEKSKVPQPGEKTCTSATAAPSSRREQVDEHLEEMRTEDLAEPFLQQLGSTSSGRALADTAGTSGTGTSGRRPSEADMQAGDTLLASSGFQNSLATTGLGSERLGRSAPIQESLTEEEQNEQDVLPVGQTEKNKAGSPKRATILPSEVSYSNDGFEDGGDDGYTFEATSRSEASGNRKGRSRSEKSEEYEEDFEPEPTSITQRSGNTAKTEATFETDEDAGHAEDKGEDKDQDKDAGGEDKEEDNAETKEDKAGDRQQAKYRVSVQEQVIQIEEPEADDLYEDDFEGGPTSVTNRSVATSGHGGAVTEGGSVLESEPDMALAVADMVPNLESLGREVEVEAENQDEAPGRAEQVAPEDDFEDDFEEEADEEEEESEGRESGKPDATGEVGEAGAASTSNKSSAGGKADPEDSAAGGSPQIEKDEDQAKEVKDQEEEYGDDYDDDDEEDEKEVEHEEEKEEAKEAESEEEKEKEQTEQTKHKEREKESEEQKEEEPSSRSAPQLTRDASASQTNIYDEPFEDDFEEDEEEEEEESEGEE